VFLGLLKHGRPILFPDITYSFYPVYCGLYGIDFERVPLDEDFRVRTDDYRRPHGGVGQHMDIGGAEVQVVVAVIVMGWVIDQIRKIFRDL
jgi:hypothetical protein